MRAESVRIDVSFEIDDNDFYVATDDKTFTDVSVNDLVDYLGNAKIVYDGDLPYVKATLDGVKVTAEVFVASSSGTSRVWGEEEWSGANRTTLNSVLGSLSDGDEVIVLFHTVIDYYSEGDQYYGKKTSTVNPDKIDDREQTIVTIEQETWSDIKGEGTGKYTTVQYVTDGSEDQLVDLIKGLREYDESHRVGSGKDRKTYRLVYSINGDEVTADWDVRPDKDEDRFGKVTPSNDKDTNGDGKVSCDEYYGTTGLEWSDKLNACVVSSTGDAVVTIPNTATK